MEYAIIILIGKPLLFMAISYKLKIKITKFYTVSEIKFKESKFLLILIV